MFHPVYSEDDLKVKITHKPTNTISQKVRRRALASGRNALASGRIARTARARGIACSSAGLLAIRVDGSPPTRSAKRFGGLLDRLGMRERPGLRIASCLANLLLLAGHDAGRRIAHPLTHPPTHTLLAQIACSLVSLLRDTFNLFTGYRPGKVPTETLLLNRFIFLETVAAVPGMVAGMVRGGRGHGPCFNPS